MGRVEKKGKRSQATNQHCLRFPHARSHASAHARTHARTHARARTHTPQKSSRFVKQWSTCWPGSERSAPGRERKREGAWQRARGREKEGERERGREGTTESAKADPTKHVSESNLRQRMCACERRALRSRWRDASVLKSSNLIHRANSEKLLQRFWVFLGNGPSHPNTRHSTLQWCGRGGSARRGGAGGAGRQRGRDKGCRPKAGRGEGR